MLDTASYFLIYVIIFRLAIITAGIISIVLGYRLFCKGVWPDLDKQQGTAFDAKVAGAHFTLKNAAPGTLFALFGVIIIIFMSASMPEFTLKGLDQATQIKTELKMRNGDNQKVDDNNTIKVLTQTCQNHYENGKTEEAITACHQAAILATDSLNMLAWLYQDQKQFTEAQTLAKASITITPKNTIALHTLAVILCKTDKHDKAQHLLKQAIDSETNPDEKDELNDLLESFTKEQCELDE